MDNSILKVSSLSHRYSVKWAVKNIDIDIKSKGIYGLLGSNGAGKSTLMNIVCGVIRQTSGEVEIMGINTIAQPTEAKKLIGFLPQKPPLHTELTIYEYLRHCAGVRMIGKKQTREAIEEAMERCSLTHMRNRLISNLSGGFQQRVGIAQAILHKPDIVILDEPTNGLDPNQILDVRELIRDIARERTVILSTHILSEVQAICDRIIMIEHGDVIFNGDIDEFDSHITPNSIFVSLANAPEISDIEHVSGVDSVECLAKTEYRLRSSDIEATLRAVIKCSEAENWGLREIYIEKNSMDDIFAVLSKKISVR